MNEGKIMQYGTPTEIHNDPSCVFVARFIGDPGMNIVAVNEEYSIGFRARDVIFGRNVESGDGVLIKSKIVSFENHGSEYLYYVEFNGRTVFVKELSKSQRAIGSEIVFTLLKDNICVFDKNESRIRDEKAIVRVYGEFKKSWSSL
jgi:sn-glycerol 3-phosphate transport system ATP-binding protein